MPRKYFDIININLTSARTDEEIADVPCGTCSLCCQRLTPFLTVEEFQSGKYPISLITPSKDDLRINPNVGPTIAMFKGPSGGCGMFIDGKCSIYEIRPIACRQFDCRKGHHPAIPDMTKQMNNDSQVSSS